MSFSLPLLDPLILLYLVEFVIYIEQLPSVHATKNSDYSHLSKLFIIHMECQLRVGDCEGKYYSAAHTLSHRVNST